jgi:hypothetical protein
MGVRQQTVGNKGANIRKGEGRERQKDTERKENYVLQTRTF